MCLSDRYRRGGNCEGRFRNRFCGDVGCRLCMRDRSFGIWDFDGLQGGPDFRAMQLRYSFRWVENVIASILAEADAPPWHLCAMLTGGLSRKARTPTGLPYWMRLSLALLRPEKRVPYNSGWRRARRSTARWRVVPAGARLTAWAHGRSMTWISTKTRSI